MSENDFYEFCDESSNHTYRTEIPNILSHIGLKGLEIAVYYAIKQVAGDNGKCTKSAQHIAEMAGVNRKTVFEIIKKLCEVNPILNKPLIVLNNRVSSCGSSMTNSIRIVDVWPDNYEFFLKRKKEKQVESIGIEKKISECKNGTGGEGVKTVQGECKNGTQIRTYYNKNLYIDKQQQQGPPKVAAVSSVVAVSFFKCLLDEEGLDDQDREALMVFAEEKVQRALAFSKQVPFTKTLIAQLIWFCQSKVEPKAPEAKVKADLMQQVKNKLEHNSNYQTGNAYKEVEIDHEINGIGFICKGTTGIYIYENTTGWETKLRKTITAFNLDELVFPKT